MKWQKTSRSAAAEALWLNAGLKWGAAFVREEQSQAIAPMHSMRDNNCIIMAEDQTQE